MKGRLGLFSIHVEEIWLPFLILTLSFAFVFPIIAYAIEILQGGVTLKNNEHLVYAAIFSALIIGIWLRPRVNLLVYKGRDDTTFYYFVALFIMVWTSHFTTEYLSVKLGKFTLLDNIHQISTKKATRYYQIKHFLLDKDFVEIKNETWVSGKRGRDLNFGMHLAIPIRNDSEESPLDTCAAWYCVSYENTVSNNLNEAEKVAQKAAFEAKSLRDFAESDLTQFEYLERELDAQYFKTYDDIIRESPRFNGKTAVILTPQYEAFENRTGGYLKYAFIGFGIASIVFLFFALSQDIDTMEWDLFLQRQKTNPIF